MRRCLCLVIPALTRHTQQQNVADWHYFIMLPVSACDWKSTIWLRLGVNISPDGRHYKTCKVSIFFFLASEPLFLLSERTLASLQKLVQKQKTETTCHSMGHRSPAQLPKLCVLVPQFPVYEMDIEKRRQKSSWSDCKQLTVRKHWLRCTVCRHHARHQRHKRKWGVRCTTDYKLPDVLEGKPHRAPLSLPGWARPVNMGRSTSSPRSSAWPCALCVSANSSASATSLSELLWKLSEVMCVSQELYIYF